MLLPRTQVNIALLGLGNVGRAFVRYIEATADARLLRIHIKAVADSTGGLILNQSCPVEPIIAHKESGGSLRELSSSESILGTDEFIRALPSAGVSILVESLPTNAADGQPALDWILAALKQGTNVVTVDKGPLVHGFDSVEEAAQKGRARIRYGGTTGVGIPEEVLTDRVLEIRGVLNGTTNYVLTHMQNHQQSFHEALEAAQAEGIAEPDASLDVQGWDTAFKILILAKSLMRTDATIADVPRTGIGLQTESLIRIAAESGRVVRLVGRARIWQGRVRVSVAPKLVELNSPFYSVSGTSKAALFRTERQGEILSLGQSGRDAISQTIVNDIDRITSVL